MNLYPDYVTPYDDVNSCDILVIYDIPVNEIVGLIKIKEITPNFWQDIHNYNLTGNKIKNLEFPINKAIPTLYYAERDISNCGDLTSTFGTRRKLSIQQYGYERRMCYV